MRAPSGRDLSRTFYVYWTVGECLWYRNIVMQCADCGAETDNANYYMIKHALWEEYGEGEAFLCVECLETRLGRLLQYADLLECPLREMFLSHRPEYWS